MSCISILPVTEGWELLPSVPIQSNGFCSSGLLSYLYQLYVISLTSRINQLHVLRKPEVQRCILKGFPIIILSRINPVPLLIPFSLRFVLILSSHLRLSLHWNLFLTNVSVKISNSLLPSSILATCPANFIF